MRKDELVLAAVLANHERDGTFLLQTKATVACQSRHQAVAGLWPLCCAAQPLVLVRELFQPRKRRSDDQVATLFHKVLHVVEAVFVGFRPQR